MTATPLKSRVLKAAAKAMGGIGESFIVRQCQRLGFDLDTLTPQQLERLAQETRANSVLIVGKVRAELLFHELQSLGK